MCDALLFDEARGEFCSVPCEEAWDTAMLQFGDKDPRLVRLLARTIVLLDEPPEDP